MNNDAANNREAATARQKLKHLFKKLESHFLFLAWETQSKTVSFMLDVLCRIISLAGIFSAELLLTRLSKTGPGQHPPILVPILSSLQWGAEGRMALDDILGRLGMAEGWQRRLSFWAERCEELCSVLCRAQCFHCELQA